MSTSNSVLKGALSLAIGTASARGLSAVSQLLLIIWLLPAEFGYWAAALASLSFFTSIANFGEINGYLSGRATSFKRMRRSTRRMNGALTLLALVVAVAIGFLNSWTVGILAVLVALSIPVQGESDVLYALGVRTGRFRRLVGVQVAAAAVKLGLGVAIAMATGSALSIAISTIVFYAVMIVGLLPLVDKSPAQSLASAESTSIPRRERFSWAVNSLVMSLPLQVGFFVAQFVTTASTLGLFYFSFQVTLGLSGLLAVPLARVSLSSFGTATGKERLRLGMDLAHALAAGVTIVVALIAILVPFAEPFMPSEWLPALPVALIMLASLPIRLISPVVEGYQQSDNKWWQSTAFNAVETVASGLIALSLAVVDLTAFALILTAWRLAFGIFRLLFVFAGANGWSMVGLVLAITLGTSAISVATFVSASISPILYIAVLAGSIFWLWLGVGARNRDAPLRSETD